MAARFPFLRTLLLAALAAIVLAEGVRAEDAAPDDVRLIRRDPWISVFGDQETGIAYRLEGADAKAGKVFLHATIEGRTLERSEAAIGPKVEANFTDADFKIKLPPVKDGVVLPAKLTAEYQADGETTAALKLEETIYLFPKDPFANKKEWLAERKIRLYDPDAQNTRHVFDKSSIPYEEINNVEAIDAMNDGFVVVGEKISLRDDRALPEILLRACARGVSVLCLEPSDGEFVLPGLSEDLPEPLEVAFRRNDIIRLLDKRLDDSQWNGAPLLKKGGLQISEQRGSFGVEVNDSPLSWPCVFVSFDTPQREARMFIVTLPIIERWEDGPTPRFLFARMLEFLSPPDKQPPSTSSRKTEESSP